MTKIITHGGSAHLDDVVSCALALVEFTWDYLSDGEPSLEHALNKACEDVVIERREPTTKELEDKRTLVLDIGGRYEPELSNFDHHQLPQGTKESAMSLYAASIELPNAGFDSTEKYTPGAKRYPIDSLAEFLEDAYPWFRTRVSVDACGPFATAKDNGVDWGTVEKFLGPFEDVILGLFEDASSDQRVNIVKPLAEMILRKHVAWEHVVPTVDYDRPWWADGEFTIADFTRAIPEDVEACSDMFTKYVDGVAIFHDNRGEGLTLLRLRDDPRIDFTKVKDYPEVAFCHNGGFIVKTKTKNVEKAWHLIEDSYVGR